MNGRKISSLPHAGIVPSNMFLLKGFW